jgi:hypothetical protein
MKNYFEIINFIYKNYLQDAHPNISIACHTFLMPVTVESCKVLVSYN